MPLPLPPRERAENTGFSLGATSFTSVPAGGLNIPEAHFSLPSEPLPTPNQFVIKLNPNLKAALKRRATTRGLDLSAYIQEVLWRHCPEVDELATTSFVTPDRDAIRDAIRPPHRVGDSLVSDLHKLAEERTGHSQE
jgi:hypothetical protein